MSRAHFGAISRPRKNMLQLIAVAVLLVAVLLGAPLARPRHNNSSLHETLASAARLNFSAAPQAANCESISSDAPSGIQPRRTSCAEASL